MSERWIKFCHETRRKPEVIRISRRLGLLPPHGRRVVIGVLLDMWILFDEQTTDGHLIGFSPEDMDAELDCDGFSAAAIEVGWLSITADGLSMPHFEEHTSQTAKARASENRRKRLSRSAGPDKRPENSGHEPGPEETRREEIRPEKKTGTERNGTAKAAGPGRAEVSSTDEQTERPSLKLTALAKTSPFLQALELLPVSGSNVIWHGSVFSPDRLKPQHVDNAPASFWLEWYTNQLTADSPVLRCGNQAEAAFVLAAVYAVRRASVASLNGAKRIARLIHWIKSREVSQISTEDFLRAAGEAAKFFGTPIPAAVKLAAESPARHATTTAAIPPRVDPAERAKPKGRKFLNELSDKLKNNAAQLEPVK